MVKQEAKGMPLEEARKILVGSATIKTAVLQL
jgi:hypothetical protein